MELTEDMPAAALTRHRELSAIADDLVLAINEKVCRYVIGHIIALLEVHCFVRFREEERRMFLSDYPGYPEHKAEHDGFRVDVFGLRRKFLNLDSRVKCASYELSVETNQVIVDWRHDHVSKADREFEIFLKYAMPLNTKISEEVILAPYRSTG